MTTTTDRVSALAERIEREESKLQRMRGALTSAHASSEAATPGGLTGYDPALLSGIRRKPDPKGTARRFAAYDREAKAATELDAQEKLVTGLRHRLAAEQAESERVHLTRDDLVGKNAVRDQYGWHKVARLNKTTVSVETGYSWTDRLKFEDVLEARTIGSQP